MQALLADSHIRQIFYTGLEQALAGQGARDMAMLTEFMHDCLKDISAWSDSVFKAAAAESEANRALFVQSPDKYKPQYNGFCANGMVYAIPLGGNHDTYKIIDGRLFMFGGAGSKRYFEMDQERNLKLAESYWKTEVQGSIPRIQSWKRLIFKVPHYKTNRELAAEWEARQGKK